MDFSVKGLVQELGALTGQQLLALGVFSSYFLLISWLFSRTFKSIRLSVSSNKGYNKNGAKILVFWGLSAASFAHTWFYMFKYMTWSFLNYESSNAITISAGPLHRIANWLANTSLFEEAWAAVCFGKINWWWSEQLCLFTVGAWTVFLYVEGSSHQIKYVWAYMLLGQLVAISVASNIFYVAILSANPPPRPRAAIAVPAKLWIPVFLSLATVAISPFTDERTFLPNLLVMHLLIVLPLFSVTPLQHTKSWFNYSILYLFIFLISISIRFRTALTAGKSPIATFDAAWKVLHSHPAQSSIGWDVLWSTISFITWITLTPSINRKFSTIPYLAATPFASVGLTAPYVLLLRALEGL